MITSVAVSPPANPLLYRSRPPCQSAVVSTSIKWMAPAAIPAFMPKRPAIGANVVQKRDASKGPGADSCFPNIDEAKTTPATIGQVLRKDFPNAPNPITVRMAPDTGPLKGPPTNATKADAAKPRIPMLTKGAAVSVISNMSVGRRPDNFCNCQNSCQTFFFRFLSKINPMTIRRQEKVGTINASIGCGSVFHIIGRVREVPVALRIEERNNPRKPQAKPTL